MIENYEACLCFTIIDFRWGKGVGEEGGKGRCRGWRWRRINGRRGRKIEKRMVECRRKQHLQDIASNPN
jgi:hypothetical protein